MIQIISLFKRLLQVTTCEEEEWERGFELKFSLYMTPNNVVKLHDYWLVKPLLLCTKPNISYQQS